MSHGGRWEAAGYTGGQIAESLPDMLKQGTTVLSYSGEFEVEEDGRFNGLYYMSLNGDPFDFVTIIGTKEGGETNLFLSAFPRPEIYRVLEVEIDRSRDCEDVFEGLVWANLGGEPLCFFAPYWMVERPEYVPGKKVRIAHRRLLRPRRS